MYVCVCKGINESQIRSAISSGLCTRKDISRSLKAGTACGKCNPEIQEMLHSCLVGLSTRDDDSARLYDTDDRERMLPLLNQFPVQEAQMNSSNAGL
jgi:bacterioferritin-associated ferredoxin